MFPSVGTIIHSIPFIRSIQKSVEFVYMDQLWMNRDKWNAMNDGPYNDEFL